MTLPSHVVLVGLPGAGKTAVGRAVARRLGCPFLDFDEEIVRREGMPITAIFASRGESSFRALEAALTREVAGREPSVLAPGGGWVVQPELVSVLRPPAALIHLRASPATALARMGPGVAGRPLIAGVDRLERLGALWSARRPAYESADHQVDTEGLEVEEVASRVIELIGRSGRAGM